MNAIHIMKVIDLKISNNINAKQAKVLTYFLFSVLPPLLSDSSLPHFSPF